MNQNLTVMEKAEQISEMIKKYNEDPHVKSPQKTVAKQWGLSERTIRNYKKIAELPEIIKEKVRSKHNCSARQLFKIAGMNDIEKQEFQIDSYLDRIDRPTPPADLGYGLFFRDSYDLPFEVRLLRKRIKHFCDYAQCRKFKWKPEDLVQIKKNFLDFIEAISLITQEEIEPVIMEMDEEKRFEEKLDDVSNYYNNIIQVIDKNNELSKGEISYLKGVVKIFIYPLNEYFLDKMKKNKRKVQFKIILEA